MRNAHEKNRDQSRFWERQSLFTVRLTVGGRKGLAASAAEVGSKRVEISNNTLAE